MAMLDPSDQREDREGALRALYVIGGLIAIMVVAMALVVLYYFGYPI